MHLIKKLFFLLLTISPAFGEPFTKAHMDWNGDGHMDRIILQPSSTIPERVDLLIYLGTSNADDFDLFTKLEGFTNTVDGIYSSLQLQLAKQPNAITIVEKGDMFGLETQIRTRVVGFRQDSTVILEYSISQTHPILHESRSCRINFETGEGLTTDNYADTNPFRSSPIEIPADKWTKEILPEQCKRRAYKLKPIIGQFKRAIEGDLIIDMNQDGIMDRVLLVNVADGVFIYVFQGQQDGSHNLVGVGRHLAWAKWQGEYRPSGRVSLANMAELSFSLDNPDTFKITTREDPTDYGLFQDFVSYISWYKDRPVISRFDVLIYFDNESTPTMHCINDFKTQDSYLNEAIEGMTRGYTEIRSPYSLYEWGLDEADEWIYDCRP